jgi:Calcineurin-like phosphoesterase.
MKILALGDIHGDFQILNSLVRKENPNIILQVGDFGYWPARDGWPPDDPELHLRDTLVYWCEGNHEDYKALEQFAEQNTCQIAPQVCYLSAGSVLTLPDNRTVLFYGGAYKSDPRRPEELPALEELKRNYGGRVDIVISHTAPASFQIRKEPPPGYAREPWLAKFEEETTKVLDRLLDLVRPQEWYFGHYHIHQTGEDRGVKWTALSASYEGSDRWWVEL